MQSLQVYLGILDGVRKVAVKIVNSPTQRHQKRFVQEIATLRACYDSNIVSFLGASVQEGKLLVSLALGLKCSAHGCRAATKAQSMLKNCKPV